MRLFAVAACLLWATFFSAGCSVTGNGAGGTLQSGRSVSVTTDKTFRSVYCNSFGPDTDSVTLGVLSPRKVLVEPTAIRVDGLIVAEIAESTKDVKVAERDGRLIITADGTSVFAENF